MASPSAAGNGGGGTAKALVSEQISQSVQSTSNLLHLMQHSSPAQAQLVKLPKNLMAKVSMIKNTEQVLEQLPRVISSLDAHLENGLQNVPQLKTVVQLLANMESSQLSSLSRTNTRQKVPTMREIVTMLKKKHHMFEVLYGWFLAKIASKLEVFPGSEFRVAYEEAIKYGGRVILGDRPVQLKDIVVTHMVGQFG